MNEWDEIADLRNRIAEVQQRLESTRTNLTITIIAMMILTAKVLV